MVKPECDRFLQNTSHAWFVKIALIEIMQAWIEIMDIINAIVLWLLEYLTVMALEYKT